MKSPFSLLLVPILEPPVKVILATSGIPCSFVTLPVIVLSCALTVWVRQDRRATLAMMLTLFLMLDELKNLGMFIISSKLDLDGHKLNLFTTSLLLHVGLMLVNSLYLGYVKFTSTNYR